MKRDIIYYLMLILTSGLLSENLFELFSIFKDSSLSKQLK